MSSIFFIWLNPLVVIWVYISVVLLLLFSSKLCIYRRSVPAPSRCVVNVKLWRKVYPVICFLFPLFLPISLVLHFFRFDKKKRKNSVLFSFKPISLYRKSGKIIFNSYIFHTRISLPLILYLLLLTTCFEPTLNFLWHSHHIPGKLLYKFRHDLGISKT